MMESTPIISPSASARRRRGQLVNTRTPTDSNLILNDDAEERRQRKRSLLLSNNLLSPVGGNSTPIRSSSGATSDLDPERTHVGMTYAQLTDYNANCVKLSSENKITSKNAFALHLIDYMKYLVRQSQKEDSTTNFQVASCTLDAGVKIYAGRVDAVHADAYKMLGSLGRATEMPSGEEDNAAPEGEPQQNKTQKKKANRGPCKTIQKNIKALNCDKFDLTFEVDPFFHKTSATFDEGGTKGLLLNHLLIKDESYELMLDSRKGMKSTAEDTLNNNNPSTVNLAPFKDISSRILETDVQLCPQFANFRFTEWDRNAEDLISEQANKSLSQDQEHRFDMDASALEPEIDTAGNDGGYMSDYDAGDGGGYEGFGDNYGDGSESGEGREGFSAAERIPRPGGGTFGPLQLEISLQPNEYSYFRQDILDTWAGPRHWKVKARSKDPAWDGAETADKNKKKRQKKAAFTFNYDSHDHVQDIANPGRATKTLAKSTIDKMSALLTTLPDDLHYDVENYTRLFSIPYLRVRRLTRPARSGDNECYDYNYNNDYDRENFCPELQNDVDDDDDDGPGEAMDMSGNATPGGFDVTVGEQSFYGGDNLVSQPNKVEKIQISYAKTAKRIDIKKLKKVMWESLTVEEEKDEAEKTTEHEERPLVKQLEDRKMDETQSFKEIYNNLPNKMSENASKNLSVPIAFVCLLYLANEKELRLTGSEDMNDIKITTEKMHKE